VKTGPAAGRVKRRPLVDCRELLRLAVIYRDPRRWHNKSAVTLASGPGSSSLRNLEDAYSMQLNYCLFAVSCEHQISPYFECIFYLLILSLMDVNILLAFAAVNRPMTVTD